MSSYNVKIIKSNRTLLKVEAKANVTYDNCLWWQLGKIISVIEKGFDSKESLAKNIAREAKWFKKTLNRFPADVTIDLNSKTITMPKFPVYTFEEVNPENCCITLVNRDGKYFARYEKGDEHEMSSVQFDRAELLEKSVVLFEEFKLIDKFVSNLLEKKDVDFILNGSKVVRLNT